MTLTIKFEFDELENSAALWHLLDSSAAQLPDELSKHAKAALREDVECHMGRRVFSRGTDILEHRLSLLIRRAFENLMPTPAQISGLFQTTLTARPRGGVS